MVYMENLKYKKIKEAQIYEEYTKLKYPRYMTLGERYINVSLRH